MEREHFRYLLFYCFDSKKTVVETVHLRIILSVKNCGYVQPSILTIKRNIYQICYRPGKPGKPGKVMEMEIGYGKF